MKFLVVVLMLLTSFNLYAVLETTIKDIKTNYGGISMGVKSLFDTNNNCHFEIFSNSTDHIAVRVSDHESKKENVVVLSRSTNARIVLQDENVIVIENDDNRAKIYLEKDPISGKSTIQRVFVIRNFFGFNYGELSCYPMSIGDGSDNSAQISNGARNLTKEDNSTQEKESRPAATEQ